MSNHTHFLEKEFSIKGRNDTNNDTAYRYQTIFISWRRNSVLNIEVAALIIIQIDVKLYSVLGEEIQY